MHTLTVEIIMQILFNYRYDHMSKHVNRVLFKETYSIKKLFSHSKYVTYLKYFQTGKKTLKLFIKLDYNCTVDLLSDEKKIIS